MSDKDNERLLKFHSLAVEARQLLDDHGIDTLTDMLAGHLAIWCQGHLKEQSKAYGGCTNCYGKGYATVNDRWLGHDTDMDIGSPGGVITGGNPNAMKFCTCERGKQLEMHIKLLKASRE